MSLTRTSTSAKNTVFGENKIPNWNLNSKLQKLGWTGRSAILLLEAVRVFHTRNISVCWKGTPRSPLFLRAEAGSTGEILGFGAVTETDLVEINLQNLSRYLCETSVFSGGIAIYCCCWQMLFFGLVKWCFPIKTFVKFPSSCMCTCCSC